MRWLKLNFKVFKVDYTRIVKYNVFFHCVTISLIWCTFFVTSLLNTPLQKKKLLLNNRHHRFFEKVQRLSKKQNCSLYSGSVFSSLDFLHLLYCIMENYFYSLLLQWLVNVLFFLKDGAISEQVIIFAVGFVFSIHFGINYLKTAYSSQMNDKCRP